MGRENHPVRLTVVVILVGFDQLERVQDSLNDWILVVGVRTSGSPQRLPHVGRAKPTNAPEHLTHRRHSEPLNRREFIEKPSVFSVIRYKFWMQIQNAKNLLDLLFFIVG